MTIFFLHFLESESSHFKLKVEYHGEPVTTTAWKVSKYGVISGPYFPVFGLNTEYGPEITPYLDTFHAVRPSTFLKGDSGRAAFKNAL